MRITNIENVLRDTMFIINWHHGEIYIIDFLTVPPWLTDNICWCTAKYNIWLDGRRVEAYCKKWGKDDETEWCYIRKSGAGSARICAGAVKSTLGNFYWSNDKGVCAGELR